MPVTGPRSAGDWLMTNQAAIPITAAAKPPPIRVGASATKASKPAPSAASTRQ